MRVSTPKTEAAPRAPGNASRSVRMLAAYMDLGASYKIAGDRQRASAELRGLHVETQVDVGGHKVKIPSDLSGALQPKDICALPILASKMLQSEVPYVLFHKI